MEGIDNEAMGSNEVCEGVLFHSLNRHYYSISHKLHENELEEKKWTDGLKLERFDTHLKTNEHTLEGTYVNWMTDEASQNENEYVNEVIIFRETLLSIAQQILMGQVFKHVLQDVLNINYWNRLVKVPRLMSLYSVHEMVPLLMGLRGYKSKNASSVNVATIQGTHTVSNRKMQSRLGK
ncbi:exocyst complex component SEC15B, partial [Tanacetum coccineum]